jgi:hypothetical protein
MLSLPNLSVQPPSRNRTGGITYEFVYKPESLIEQLRQGSYGEPLSYKDCHGSLALPGEAFCGVALLGTPAARDKLKLSIEPLYNYGFWDDIVATTTTVVAQPFTDAMGCGECPGSTIWISPEYSVLENIDTAYHEWLHNLGWTAEPLEHAWIYQQAAKVTTYLAQFGV